MIDCLIMHNHQPVVNNVYIGVGKEIVRSCEQEGGYAWTVIIVADS